MGTKATLYDEDFYAWTQEQAALLREGAVQELDLLNLAEEIESLGRSEQRALYNRLRRLLRHLLKLHIAAGRGWRTTVRVQRLEVAKLLRDEPSLVQTVPQELADAYVVARIQAAGDLALDEGDLPETCPWKDDQVLDGDFWPEG